jgi:hypothetical protein
MKTTRNKYYLLNFVFLICLLTLLLNDHYLKYEFANGLTGNLSDMAGIIILPLLLAFLFPKLKQHTIWISALLFGFWKSPYSQDLIDFYNQYTFIQTSRIIDYTDLYVLLFLSIPYFLITRIDSLDSIKIKHANPLLLLLPTILTLMATSLPPSHYYTRTQGNLACYKCNITINYKQDEIVEKLKRLDIFFDSIAPIDTFALTRVPNLKNENAHVYRLNQLVIDKDTLMNLDFTMRTIKNRKTKIYFNGMQVSDDISSLILEIKLRNYYKKILFKELKNMLRE